MAQQALDFPVVEAEAPCAGPQEPEPPSPLPGWLSIPHAIIRAEGEEGYVDLAALNVARGVALVCLLDKDEEASPEEARAALRAMLREEGLEKDFPGELPVVAIAVPRAQAAELAAMIERAFAGMPRPTLSPGWVDWLAERLAPSRAAPDAAPPPLSAPSREEAPPEKPETGLALDAPPSDQAVPERTEASVLDLELEAPPAAAANGASLLDWGTSLGFAFGMILALLACLALISYNGRLF